VGNSSSTAGTHSNDFEKIVEMAEFENVVKTPTGDVKPVVVFTVDG